MRRQRFVLLALFLVAGLVVAWSIHLGRIDRKADVDRRSDPAAKVRPVDDAP